MSLEFGVTVTGRPAGDVDPVQQAEDVCELARVARDSGFGALVVGQHFLSAPYRYFQPSPLLARLVPETGDMRLVSGILLLPLLAPVEVAEQFATIDVLSGGRLVFGVGLGYREEEFEAFGVLRKERVRRQVEALELIKALWRGGPVSHSGEFYSAHADGAGIVPVQRPHPEIWVAANAQKSAERAVRQGYVPYIGPRPERSVVAGWIDRLREHNPDITIPIRREMFVVEHEREVPKALEHMAARFAMYKSWGVDSDGSGTTVSPQERDMRQTVVVGTPDQCAEQLAEYRDLGVSSIVFRVIWPGLAPEQSFDMVRMIGEHIIPQLNEPGS